MKKNKVGIIWMLVTILSIGIISGVWIYSDSDSEQENVTTLVKEEPKSPSKAQGDENKDKLQDETSSPNATINTTIDTTIEVSKQPTATSEAAATKEPEKTTKPAGSEAPSATKKPGKVPANATAKPAAKPNHQSAASKPSALQQTQDSVTNTPAGTPIVTPVVTPVITPVVTPVVTAPPAPTKAPTVAPTKEPAVKPVGTITLSVDASVIGCGTLKSGMSVELYQGESASHAVTRGLKKAGFSYSNTGSLEKSFYLARISKSGMISNPTLSNRVKDILDENGVKANMTKYSKDSLGEFDFTKYSGWRYSVNGSFAGVGMSDYSVKPGDRVLLKYTLCLGKDA